MKLIKYAVLIGAVCGAFAMQPAKADFISTLNVGNDAISGFPGPYGTVTVHLDSSTQATITFTANTASGYWFIDGGAAAVEVNATSFTPAIVTDSDFKQFDSGNVDGFGSFNLVIDNNNASNLVDLIVFTVTNDSGTWANAGDVLAFNAGGGNPGGPFDAAAHISIPGGGVTGFAGEGPGGVTTPDSGATAALLGLGLVSLAGLRAKFGRN